MTEPTFTLRSFFLDEISDGDADEAAQAIGEAVKAVPGMAWPGAAKVITGKLAEALDVGFSDILAKAWNSHQEIQHAARESLRRPGESVFVPLARHRLISSHDPSVEIEVNDQPVHRLVFNLRLSLELEGAVLELRDGRIREVSAGNCRGEGQIKLGDAVLARRQSGKIQILGAVGLGEGLPVPGVDAHPVEAA